jgi:stage II sporulation protein AA (anti-sigma F factor antagonist)
MRGVFQTMNLQVNTMRAGEILIVYLKGELDHHTAPKVREIIEQELLEQEYKHILLNMSSLEFMDSSGIGMILGRYKQLLSRGGKMGICEMAPSIYRLLEMSGLFKILIVSDTERHAISRLEVLV